MHVHTAERANASESGEISHCWYFKPTQAEQHLKINVKVIKSLNVNCSVGNTRYMHVFMTPLCEGMLIQATSELLVAHGLFILVTRSGLYENVHRSTDPENEVQMETHSHNTVCRRRKEGQVEIHGEGARSIRNRCNM